MRLYNRRCLMNPVQTTRRMGLKMAILLTVFGMDGLTGWSYDRTVKCRVEIDRNILPADENQRAVIKITLDALTPPKHARQPVNLAIVLDRSGSMRGEKLEKAKEAAIQALRRLDARDIFSLVVYDTQVETIVPAQSVENTEWIESRIRHIAAGNSTALFGGVSQGAAEIRKNLDRKYVHRIILLSDGIANVGPSAPEDLGRLGAALIKEGIAVTTVGVGTDYNEDLMTRLSRSGDGNTYFVESSVDLPRIFNAELGDVLSIVAQQVYLTIECSDGVRPVAVIGRDGRIRGQTVELYLNQLYGGQEKYALVEVEIPAGKHGATLTIASARVTYENPFTRKKETSGAEVSSRFSKDQREVDNSDNATVKKAYYLTINAVGEERAIMLADEGKKEDAADLLRSSAAELKAAGIKYDDRELKDKAQAMDASAGEIEKEGMSSVKRKTIRTESYQQINQQVSY
ncbi:MAG: VWA domain-containing protein [Lentisphaerae bacterium]|nr:VWA domain-containing protein [Lentisphaerota bacterium]